MTDLAHRHSDHCTHDSGHVLSGRGDLVVDPAQFTRPQRFMLWAIRYYQTARDGRPSPCRFWPSCSHYAVEAIETHGSARGFWLSLRRLSRCRPFGPSGVDPVPAPRSGR